MLKVENLKIKENNDILVAVCVIGIIMMIIIPLPSIVLDLMIAINISLSAIIFIITLFTTNVLQMTIFPSLLLVTTLFRLALNISSTRLILSTGDAGTIIEAFGDFVIGGNYVVGIIIFLIIMIIQFIVITNGSGRVSEVSARFTLDAMPGKQMAIDSDLNAGLIDEEQAKVKRSELQQEASFYGAMDGASKFVKGDAISSIIVTVINIVGGIIIGVLQMNMDIGEAAGLFVKLTVGDGLVSQIPALLISTAVGILVTRSGSEQNFGKTFTKQLSAYPIASAIAAGIMILLFLVPGMPKFPFFISALCMIAITYLLYKEEKNKEVEEDSEIITEEPIERTNEPENLADLVSIEPLEVEIGFSLIPLADEASKGDLLQRIASVRRQCAIEMGVVLQPIRIRDNLSLKNNEYAIKIRGITVGSSELIPNMLLCINSNEEPIDLVGIETVEPTFNIPALWINKEQKENAEIAGLTVVDPSTVIVTHLTEVIKNNAHSLLGRQEVKTIIDNIKDKYSAVVEELIPDILTIGDVQKVLQNLLKEKVVVKDMVTILETLADYAKNTRDLELLTEYVRMALGRSICNNLLDSDKKLKVLILSQDIEDIVSKNIQKSHQGSFLSISPDITHKILNSVKKNTEKVHFYNNKPIILVTPNIRMVFKKFLDMSFKNITVLSLNEIPSDIEISSEGVIEL